MFQMPTPSNELPAMDCHTEVIATGIAAANTGTNTWFELTGFSPGFDVVVHSVIFRGAGSSVAGAAGTLTLAKNDSNTSVEPGAAPTGAIAAANRVAPPIAATALGSGTSVEVTPTGETSTYPCNNIIRRGGRVYLHSDVAATNLTGLSIILTYSRFKG